MNRIAFTLFLAVLAIVTMAIPAPAQTMSTIQKGAPLNAGETPMTGFAAFATPTVTFSAGSVAQQMPPVPGGTVAATVMTSGAAVNYGDANVKDDAVASFPTIAAGAEQEFNIYPNTAQPSIWFVPTASATVTTIRFIAHIQR